MAPCFIPVLFAIVVSNFVGFADANAFLKAGFHRAAERIPVVDVDNAMSSEPSNVFSRRYGASMLSDVVVGLRPLFDALPKNEYGNLGHAAVRYALHRFFVKKHGWFVKGIDSVESAKNMSSTTALLKDRVASHIQERFDRQLGGHGLNLSQLAALASTIEHLVHNEAMGRLETSYSANGLLTSDHVTEHEAGEIVDAYMMSFIVDMDLSKFGKRQLDRFMTSIGPKVYPGWADTQEWLRDMQSNVVYADRGVNNPFGNGDLNFPQIAHIVEEIGDRYGKFQDLECQGLKDALMERRNGSGLPGRVKLPDFYKTGLGGKVMFTETIEYLRELGVLDEESDPEVPSVVVPNYLSSKTNCLGGHSSFYSVCCISECEGLLGQLESKIAAPTADSQRIAEIVAGVASDTVDAPRNLSSALLDRLDSIAQRHGGHVPLHGRLFAQWMHHAYPNECPYPQLVTDPEMVVANAGRSMSQSEMSLWSPNAGSADADKEMPWIDVEELLLQLDDSPEEVAQSEIWIVFRNLGFMAALLSFAISVARTCQLAIDGSDVGKLDKASPKVENHAV